MNSRKKRILTKSTTISKRTNNIEGNYSIHFYISPKIPAKVFLRFFIVSSVSSPAWPVVADVEVTLTWELWRPKFALCWAAEGWLTLLMLLLWDAGWDENNTLNLLLGLFYIYYSLWTLVNQRPGNMPAGRRMHFQFCLMNFHLILNSAKIQVFSLKSR